MIINCVVACRNANGEPDLAFVKVECNQEQYDAGVHYDAASEWAEDQGYEPRLVFDENDPPQPLFSLFEWETASTVVAELAGRQPGD